MVLCYVSKQFNNLRVVYKYGKIDYQIKDIIRNKNMFFANKYYKIIVKLCI